ncbi:tetratricopeptide repeat protein [Mucilaginibacter gracilis]|uniref:Tetratricopeptide repeat protein n=1 Tax=Mucilaginibacter gracilis TaxID=423350 RepID=A0A495IYH9_9SPHI|nr:tetratricopeptide repeat protein [Mucilaginibacter gracilis]RKR81622.1 tetratricopeptide repeat protein [Mucilaginibacter gracilis]
MQKKQIVVIVIVLAIVCYLYKLPVKGLIKPKEARTSSGAKITETRAVSNNIDVNYVSAPAKTAIGTAIALEITALENSLKNAGSTVDKIKFETQLAKKWDDVNQPAPAAFYYQAIAREQNGYQDWLNAGDRFNDAFKFTQDTLAQPAFVQNSVEAFKNALKIKPESLDAQTGLGIADVNGGAPSPMEGIGLLLGVVGKEPNNRKALLNLGTFAMKSGQYQKAVERFKTLIAQKDELEPNFYLAESYKQLGMKQEAIAAYQKCKSMMPDPAFGARIDEYIKELKN